MEVPKRRRKYPKDAHLEVSLAVEVEVEEREVRFQKKMISLIKLPPLLEVGVKVEVEVEVEVEVLLLTMRTDRLLPAVLVSNPKNVERLSSPKTISMVLLLIPLSIPNQSRLLSVQCLLLVLR